MKGRSDHTLKICNVECQNCSDMQTLPLHWALQDWRRIVGPALTQILMKMQSKLIAVDNSHAECDIFV